MQEVTIGQESVDLRPPGYRGSTALDFDQGEASHLTAQRSSSAEVPDLFRAIPRGRSPWLLVSKGAPGSSLPPGDEHLRFARDSRLGGPCRVLDRVDSTTKLRRVLGIPGDLLGGRSPGPGHATLEIGCGEGRVARDMACRGHSVTAVDASPTLLEAAAASDPGPSIDWPMRNSSLLPTPLSTSSLRTTP